MKRLLRRPIRQWLPLTALAFGLLASAIGASVGQPNSWWWFLGGALVAVMPAVLVLLLRRHRIGAPEVESV